MKISRKWVCWVQRGCQLRKRVCWQARKGVCWVGREFVDRGKGLTEADLLTEDLVQKGDLLARKGMFARIRIVLLGKGMCWLTWSWLCRCTTKGEEDYRPLFENFVQDLLSTVNKPEWPSSELLLSLLGRILVRTPHPETGNRLSVLDCCIWERNSVRIWLWIYRHPSTHSSKLDIIL